MKIEKLDRFVASHKQGSIKATKAQIVKVLGFEPNVDDDASKVVNSWAFTIDGEDAAIWDWKGSDRFNEYSYYNPKVAELFGKVPTTSTNIVITTQRLLSFLQISSIIQLLQPKGR